MEDNVNHPNHYECPGPVVRIECIDVARHLSFNRGNAFKYLWRCCHKGGRDQAVEDLRKALWYLEDGRLNFDSCKWNVPEAAVVFRLIPREAYQLYAFEMLRYRAMFDIVHGEDPSETICEMINYLLGEKEDGK